MHDHRPVIDVHLSTGLYPGGGTYFGAERVTVDGVAYDRRTYPRLMFEIINDQPGSGTFHAHPSAPPIDELLWIKAGLIVDAEGTMYERTSGVRTYP